MQQTLLWCKNSRDLRNPVNFYVGRFCVCTATHSAYPVRQGSLLSRFNVSTGRDACSVEYCSSSGVRSKNSGRVYANRGGRPSGPQFCALPPDPCWWWPCGIMPPTRVDIAFFTLLIILLQSRDSDAACDIHIWILRRELNKLQQTKSNAGSDRSWPHVTFDRQRFPLKKSFPPLYGCVVRLPFAKAFSLPNRSVDDKMCVDALSSAYVITVFIHCHVSSPGKSGSTFKIINMTTKQMYGPIRSLKHLWPYLKKKD